MSARTATDRTVDAAGGSGKGSTMSSTPGSASFAHLRALDHDLASAVYPDLQHLGCVIPPRAGTG